MRAANYHNPIRLPAFMLPAAILATAILATAILAAGGTARANPEGGTVVAGDAAITQASPGEVVIDQRSEQAIINWQAFSIGAGELTRFLQPSASAVVLNRVTGARVSEILGRLSANGRVYLINPNGIVFGPDAVVDVAGLIASVHDIGDRDFLIGQLDFDISGAADAGIVNQGLITAAEGGLIALVAPWVRNSGVIEARLGRIVLAGAMSATVDPYGDDLIVFQAGSEVVARLSDPDSNPLAALVENGGTIAADGGRVLITVSMAKDVVDGAINMTGYVQARSAELRNGEIVLNGGPNGTTLVAGTLDASGLGAGETGGTVKVLGAQVGLIGPARIDVSGDLGGGRALVGGAFQGLGPEPNALRTYVGGGATIAADAITGGDGGEVIVWADENTRYYGAISARGGAGGGDGGSVEISGKQNLAFFGTADVSAPLGSAGRILLDPDNITIISGAGADDAEVGDSEVLFADGDAANFSIGESALESLTGNVLLEADTDILVSAGLTGGLTFSNQTSGETVDFIAGRHITVNSSISINGADLRLEADQPESGAAQDGIGTITLASGQSLTTSGGLLDLVSADIDIQGTIDSGSGDIKIGPNSARSFSLGAVAADFNLTDPELDRITTSGTLKLGGPDATSIELDGFSYSGSLLWIGSDTGSASIVFLGLTSSASGLLGLQSTSSISGGVSGGDISANELEIESTSAALTGSVGGLTGQDAADAIVLTATGGGPFTFNGFTIPLTLTETTAAAFDSTTSLIATSPDTTTTTTTTTTTDTTIVEPLDATTSETTTIEETIAVVEEIATSESLAEAVDYMTGEGELTLSEQTVFFETLDGTEVVDGLLASGDPLAHEIGQVFEDVLAGHDVSQAEMKAELQAMGLSGGKLLTYLGLYLRVQKEKRGQTLKLALEELAEDDGRTKVKVRAARMRAGSGRRVALLIGVQDYAEPIPDLVTPLGDVAAIAALLESKLGYETRVLKNPTKAEIAAALQALVDELGERDSAIIMYAGHGYVLESTGVGYWLPADARTDSAEQWISNTSISEMLNAIQSKNVMLIADSCYSGTLLSGEHAAGGVREGVRVKLSREQLRDKRSVVILSSGGEEPVQDAGGDGHSVFARQLMTVLGSMRADGVGSELYQRIKSSIAELAPQVPQYGGVISAGHELGGDYLLELGS